MNFRCENLIGKGSHAKVFLGKLKDSRKCAVKMLDYPDVEELDNEFLLKVISAYSTLSTILDMALFINICIKGLFSNFIYCCRFSPFQDWSTTMLFNFLATV
jgi:pto-interacting protein 1